MKRLDLAMWGSIAVLSAIVAVVSWFAWTGPAAEQPRARQYRDYDICLLTGQAGLNDPAAAAAWRQLLQVSLETKVRASYLPVTGEQTEARAGQLIAAQVQQRCGVIVATGPVQISAANAAKSSHPQVLFLTPADPAREDLTEPLREHIPHPQ